MEALAIKKVVVVMGLVVALALVLANGEQSIICGMSMEGLSSCQAAVTGSNPTRPSVKCCQALSKADLNCFCGLMKDKAKAKAYGINVDRAKKVPGMCKPSVPFNC